MIQLSTPRGVIFDQSGTVYIVDSGNSRVVCWTIEAEQGTLIASGFGQGNKLKQLYSPETFRFDSNGNLYVPDWG